MNIDIAAFVEFIGSFLGAVWFGLQLLFYGFGSLWFYLNCKNEAQKGG